MKTYLLLHGWGGKANEHWLTWLKNELKKSGGKVIYPHFPNAQKPILNDWLEHLKKELEGVNSRELTVVAHSLGCNLWWHFLKKHPETKPKKVFLVAPPFTFNNIPEIKNFFPSPKLSLADQAKQYLIIGSNNDPFILKEDFELCSQNYKIPFHFIANAGHINIGSGYGPFPWLLEKMLEEQQ